MKGALGSPLPATFTLWVTGIGIGSLAPVPAQAVLDWRPLARLLDSAVAAGAAPGGVVAISIGGVRYIHGTGRLGQDDSTQPGPETVYDLASLTKVVGLTTGLMLAVSEGRLDLDAPVQRYLPEFTGRHKEQVTLRHLLTHSSGLPDHRRLWVESADRRSALALVNQTELDTAPGARTVYSDLGAIVLTQVLESVYQQRIDSLLANRVFQPLGMSATRYLPPPDWLPRIAPTENDPWRGRVLRGEVHDENAAWLGGISGHAGLFSNAGDLLGFGEMMVEGMNVEPKAECTVRTAEQTKVRCNHPASCTLHAAPCPPPGLSHSVVREFTRRQNLVEGSSRALGWDTPSPNSSAGTLLGPRSVGHTGFTGTSIWMDPSRRLVVVLLTNRVHPTRQNSGHIPLRRAVADLAVRIADASSLVDM
jgi:CubicO group peptidase (beta-lactamase class C family)